MARQGLEGSWARPSYEYPPSYRQEVWVNVCRGQNIERVRVSGLHQPPVEKVGSGKGKFDLILGTVAHSVPISHVPCIAVAV